MECMCAQTRPRFILSSERVWGNGVRTHVNSRRKKSPLPKNSPPGRIEPTTLHQAGQPNTLPTELFWPPRSTVTCKTHGSLQPYSNQPFTAGGFEFAHHLLARSLVIGTFDVRQIRDSELRTRRRTTPLPPPPPPPAPFPSSPHPLLSLSLSLSRIRDVCDFAHNVAKPPLAGSSGVGKFSTVNGDLEEIRRVLPTATRSSASHSWGLPICTLLSSKTPLAMYLALRWLTVRGDLEEDLLLPTVLTLLCLTAGAFYLTQHYP